MPTKKTEEKKKGPWMLVLGIFAGLILVSFLFAFIISLAVGTDFQSFSGNVAVIEVTGPIMGDGASGIFSSAASSEDVAKLIRKADKARDVDAIVIKINSPGGSAVASDEIGQALKAVEKPTVAWIREVGASGGYWIASASDHIIVNRLSITGSIGVIASYLEFGGLLEDYNITYQRMVAGDLKDIGSPFRGMTAREERLFQESLDEMHDFFIQEVADNRGMTFKEVKKLATGIFYTGQQAYDLGLVDELGGREEVIAYLEGILETDDIDFIKYETEKGFFDTLAGAQSRIFYTIGQGFGDAVLAKTENTAPILRT